MWLDPKYQPIFRRVGLDADEVFVHPAIKVWRSLPERENCTLDTEWDDGRPLRLHIKRYNRASGSGSPAEDEARGLRLLAEAGIPTAPLVAWGALGDGRSFIILEDLSGYTPADKLVAAGTPFSSVLEATAQVAAKLHRGGLHHRDLYLCHFLARDEAGKMDIRLIDAGRVRKLPGWPWRTRWIVKDLAQFWYSTLSLGVTDEQRRRWLAQYATASGPTDMAALQRKIERKSAWIARHDAKLQRAQPRRNISIPPSGAPRA